MPNLNPAGAAARMLSTKTNTKAECLVAVGAAELQGIPVLDHALTAAIAWADAGAAHQHTTHAPADYPMFFTGAGGSGDVVISVGDGIRCVASDYMTGGVIHWGRTGTMTLADRARQVGGKLRGWTDLFLGYTLTGTDPSGGGGTPVNPKGRRRDMDKCVILYDNLFVIVDFAALTTRVAGTGEAYQFQLEKDAGLQIIQTVSEATWQETYAKYTRLVAPVTVAAGSGGAALADIAKSVQAISDNSDKKIAAALPTPAQLVAAVESGITGSVPAAVKAGLTGAKVTTTAEGVITA
jgi:hypothetical protein